MGFHIKYGIHEKLLATFYQWFLQSQTLLRLMQELKE